MALSVLHPLTTGFVGRLRARDPAAWFELWENFGPILRRQLQRWGRGRIGQETVQDLSQETLVALAGAIDRHDPSKGARFSTWLLTIARYTLGDEMDRRTALKRGGGARPRSLDEGQDGADGTLGPDASYEQQVFDAKVEAALRAVERDAGFMDFSIFRMRVLEGRPGKEVAENVGTSQPTISRRLAKVRELLRRRLEQVITRYSFTEAEIAEAERNGLSLLPNDSAGGDLSAGAPFTESAFDEAVQEIYHRIAARRTEDAAETTS